MSQATTKLSDKYKQSKNGASGNETKNVPATVQKPMPPVRQKPVQNISVVPPRQPNITVVCGMTGVGKSFTSIQEIKASIKIDPARGKRGRPAFIFDTNMEEEYERNFPKAIKISEVTRIVNPECCRILPYNDDGSYMNSEQMRQACIKLGKEMVYNALLLLDDYDKYCSGSQKTRDMTVLFMSNRHRGQDLILVHQSLGMITPIEMRNATMFRLHKCNDSIDTIKDRFPNYSLVKIAELIIDEQFKLAEEHKHRLPYKEYMKRRSFFLYINVRTEKIIGNISLECYLRNCRKFVKLNKYLINNYVDMHLDGDESAPRDEIINRIIQDEYMRYYTPPGQR